MKKVIKGGFLTAFFLVSFIAFTQTDADTVQPIDESTIIFGQDNTDSVSVAPQSSSVGAFFQVVFALGIVIALIYGFIYLLRRLSGRTSVASNSISILSSQSLTSSTSIHIIDIEGHLYIVGSGDDVNLISKVSDQEQIDKIRLNAEKNDDIPLNFMQLLAERLKKENLEVNKTPRRQFMNEQTKRLKNLSKDKNNEDKQ